MRNQKSHKIIVAGGMAAALAVGAVTFVMHQPPVTVKAQTSLPPPPFEPLPDVHAAVAPVPEVATVAPVPEPSAAVDTAPASVQSPLVLTETAAPDSQITTEVKSEIAKDALDRDLAIGVTTTQGVVALTGSLASQDAIDHVRDVAAKVRDVRSVDTSALIIATL